MCYTCRDGWSGGQGWQIMPPTFLPLDFQSWRHPCTVPRNQLNDISMNYQQVLYHFLDLKSQHVMYFFLFSGSYHVQRNSWDPQFDPGRSCGFWFFTRPTCKPSCDWWIYIQYHVYWWNWPGQVNIDGLIVQH